MSPARVEVERQGAVAFLRYEGDRDRLCVEGLCRLRAAVDDALADPSVRVLVLTGAPGRFPRMMDPEEAGRLAAAAPPVPRGALVLGVRLALAVLRRWPAARRWLDHPARRDRAALLHQRLLSEALSSGRAVTIAAMAGPVFGGGLELALACDLRVVSDGPDSFFAQPELLGDVMVGFGGAERLARVVGEPRALDLLLTGRCLDPATALDWGLVSRVLPASRFAEEVEALAQTVARRSPAALGGTVRAVRAAAGRSPEGAREVELREMLGVWQTPEARAGLRRVADEIARLPPEAPLPPLPELLSRLT